MASDIDVQLLQVLRKAPAFQNQGMVREYDRMKTSNRSQFTGDRMNYYVWKRRFIARLNLSGGLFLIRKKLWQLPLTK
jgi:hypothetical protein